MAALRRVDRPLPHGVADRAVAGHHVPDGSTFTSMVASMSDRSDPVLVVFLRHYG